MNKMTLGFVGLGAMGNHSARRLIQAGYKVQGFDLRQSSLDQLKDDGGEVMASAVDVMKGAEATIIFLVNAQQAESVLFGDNGLAADAPKGHTIISCVTMAASDARRLGQRCETLGLRFVDAPVSGGVVGAKNGTLSIMASGNDEALDICTPIFSSMGERVLRVGSQPGQGSTFKTINQMLCGVHLAVAGEALALADKAGLDTEQVFDLVSKSAASSWMLNDRGPAMVKRDYSKVTSAVDIFVKDMGVVVDLSRDLRFPAPVSAAALQSFLGASGAGFGQSDDSAVTEFYRLTQEQHGDVS